MPSFARDVKPLFRPRDRRVMDFVFDLWSYQDVREHAPSILDRIEDGTMPCDQPWDGERIDLFRRWMDEGFEP